MSTLFLGIDPGVNGGVASICEDYITLYSAEKGNDSDLWSQIAQILAAADRLRFQTFAVIERQVPRPTWYFNRERNRQESSILKSTCVLYGHYQFLRGLLTAASIPTEEVLPKRWQQVLGIAPRVKGRTDSEWKNELKAHAQRLYPQTSITLATADALLLAEYGRRLRTGEVLLRHGFEA